MSILRAQCSFGADVNLPRDRIVITPHFKTISGLDDAQSLADDLADALAGWASSGREVQVKMYDAQGTKPVYPTGEAIRNANVCPPSSVPRELAVCLSYYADNNRPRRRGRLYIPACVAGFSVTSVRPTQVTTTDKVAALVPIFADLGGVDIDWVVYSRADDQAHTVTNWFIDDEWDTVRSRGLRPTNRVTGTTGG